VRNKHPSAATGELDEVFAALADPSRRAILGRLAAGPATVGTVAEPLAMAKPSVSKHVKVLERAGLVHREVRGREHWLRLAPEGFASATAWFEHYLSFWAGSADRLAELVADLHKHEGERDG
jgi:DNA-binding transcriptional ArsR family regulator